MDKIITPDNNRPIQIYQIILNNLSLNLGGPLKKGGINLITNREPLFIYNRIGNEFIAEDDGFVHTYAYSPGTTRGFAGRPIKIPVWGGVVFKNKGYHYEEYKGSLWSSVSAVRKYEQITGKKLFSIAQKSDAEYRKCPVFCSAYVTEERMDKIKEHMSFK